MNADPTAVGTPAWHSRPEAVARFVADLVVDEVTHLRPGGAQLPERPWPPELRLDEYGLGLDSLERFSVASALDEALHLNEFGNADRLLERQRFDEWVEVASAGLAHSDVALTFRTSGSQGLAKPCTHALANLQQEVDHLAGLWPGTQRILSAVPAHHIYGFLCTVLLPCSFGGIAVHDIRRTTPQALARLLQPGDLVVSHPTHWAAVARHVGRLPPGVNGLTSTAPCPDELAQWLGDAGLATLTQVYGSSETAGVATRTAAGAPFRLMPFWSRDGGDAQRLQRASVEGPPRWHDLQDNVAWLDRQRFSLGGRRDDAVQVGGVNVFPMRVRQVLLEHPEVVDAAVRPMSPEEGSRLKAFVVCRPGTDPVALQSTLWAWTASRLTMPERPKAFTLGDQLPRNGMGKLVDWPLHASGPGC